MCTGQGHISHPWVVREPALKGKASGLTGKTLRPRGRWAGPASACSYEMLGPCAPMKAPAFSLTEVQRVQTRGAERDRKGKKSEGSEGGKTPGSDLRRGDLRL